MTKVGRYELAGEVGRGASGIVFRATDPSIGRPVAVKIIRLDGFSDPAEREQLRERLFREARSAGALLHPNIVTIFDVGEERDLAYIAMELVNGKALDDWTGAIPNETFLAVMEQAAAALDFAHSKGVAHRDIKPANILVDVSGQAKLLDFGIARPVSQQMTHSGMLVGTPNYMSPEQIENKPVDGRSDQFSLAVIAYELLTGEKPFQGNTLPGLLYQIANQNPQAAHLLNPSLPPAASAAIQRALSKHAIGRFRTCAAFVEELTRTLSMQPGWHALPMGGASDLPTVAAAKPVASSPPVPKPTLPTLPEAQATWQVPARRRMGIHWSVWLFIPALIVAAVFVYWVAGGPSTAAVEEPFTIADSSRPTPLPGDTVIQPPEGEPAATEASSDAPSSPPAEPGLPTFDSSEPVLIRINTIPAGARVSADSDARQCTSPCSMLLDRGMHNITYTLDTYRPLTRRIEVPKQAEVEVVLERATGTLMLRSNPAGASVFIDGAAMAEKTPSMLTLPIGKHRLRLTLEGKPAYEEGFEIKDQVISTINIDW